MKRDGIKGYKAPSYPKREAVDDEALVRWMPARWRGQGKVAAGMALLFASAPGVEVARADTATPPGGKIGPNDKASKDGTGKRAVAVFEHGEGRGAFGCVAVAPPAFLTEADARQVILEEFAKVGVKFQLDKKVVAGLKEHEVVETYREAEKGKWEAVRKEKELGPLTIDGYDPGKNVGFEYISEGDYFRMGGPRSSSSVQSYDFKPLAKRLAEEAKRDGTVRLGVFYDPMARTEWVEGEDGDYRAPRNRRGEEQLRAQVRDFINFLKAEKVL